ncbi:hypothetical protein ACFXTO_023276 [Malus domestica]
MAPHSTTKLPPPPPLSLLTDNVNTKDDLRLLTDDSLLTQIKDGFNDGKDLVVIVMYAMGKEQRPQGHWSEELTMMLFN